MVIAMSMNAHLRRIAPGDVRRLRDDAGFRAALLGGGPMDALARQIPWYLRWFIRLPAGPGGAKSSGAPPQGEVLDLHKSWHGLHWLICQDAWEGPFPLRHALFGAEEVGEDLGYGPPQLSSPEIVTQVSKALDGIDERSLMKRFDGARMTELEIYPGGWDEDDSWESELARDFARLRKFYSRAAQAGDGVLTWLE